MSTALLPCPRPGCGTAVSDAGRLAAHLVTVHLTAPSGAHHEAQAVKQQADPQPLRVQRKEATMACTYCKRADGTHTEKCKTRTRPPCKICARVAPAKCARHGGPSHHREARQQKSARKWPRGTQEPDLPVNSVRVTARTLLGQLEALRVKLDARIAVVRELAEIL